MLSEESIVIPLRPLNEAATPSPFTYPIEPLPTRVDVAPEGVTMRMRLESTHSATARSPLEKEAIAPGLLNDAAVPTPFTDDAAPEPASVVTTRDPGEIMRMRWFRLSAIARLPSGRTATP